jgi:hypothetical membrane protein
VRTEQLRYGGVVGPVAFVGAWVLTGLATDGYSPVDDPISELAAVDAPYRWWMTAGFVIFTGGLVAYGCALRARRAGPAWIAAVVTGVATLGVAALPLDQSSAVDTAHGVAAGTGYIALGATALLSARVLARNGAIAWARFGAAIGVVTLTALALTLAGSANGFWQRLGLTTGDVWIVATALAWPQLLGTRHCGHHRDL